MTPFYPIFIHLSLYGIFKRFRKEDIKIFSFLRLTCFSFLVEDIIPSSNLEDYFLQAEVVSGWFRGDVIRQAEVRNAARTWCSPRSDNGGTLTRLRVVTVA